MINSASIALVQDAYTQVCTRLQYKMEAWLSWIQVPGRQLYLNGVKWANPSTNSDKLEYNGSVAELVEGARLEIVYTATPYRGFESLRFRIYSKT